MTGNTPPATGFQIVKIKDSTDYSGHGHGVQQGLPVLASLFDSGARHTSLAAR